MKISVITLHAVRNYGSILQTYATQNIFRQLGLEVEIIDYRRKVLDSDSLIKIIKNDQFDIKWKIKLCLLIPSTIKIKKIFDNFLKEKISLTDKIYSSEQDFTELPMDSDVYCTGSDQVWNSGWHNGIPYPFFLSFVPETKRLISFSASFGKDKLDEWEREPIRQLLERYDYISVREKSGKQILDDLGFDKSVHVLDPTLAINPQEWYHLADKNKLKEKYILVYQLNNNKKFDLYAKELANRRGLKLIRLCTRYDQMRKTGKGIVIPRIETFLSLFRDAEYVITDSFHATAFSLIFHKKFLCIYPGMYNTRLQSILNLVGLNDRHLTDFSNFDEVDSEINYEEVDRILDNNRKITMDFLKEATKV